MNNSDNRLSLEKALEHNIDLSDRDVLIFGAGNTSLLYSECFEKEGIEIKAFIDNDPNKHGVFLGKQVYTLDEAEKLFNNPFVLICSTNEDTFRLLGNMLQNKNIEHCLTDEYVFRKNKEKLLQIYDSLSDDLSKAVYADVILARMGIKPLDEELVSSNQYFAVSRFTRFSPKECFVDCGAYVGDTIEQYLNVKEGCFGKIYAFEPDIRNFNALTFRTERLRREWALPDDKIILINGGVGKSNYCSAVHLAESDSLGSKLTDKCSEDSDTDNKIRVYALDSYFDDKKVSFIKADIESFEEDMLLGAENIIKRDRPIIAVCIYHNASDMYRIPLLLKNLDPSYKLSVRHHRYELCDTVLYAY